MAGKSLNDDIANGVRGDSSLFTIYSHVGRQGYSPRDVWDFNLNEPISPWVYDQWVPSASCAIPKSGWQNDEFSLAVRLFNGTIEGREDEFLWLHIKPSDKNIAAAFKFYCPNGIPAEFHRDGAWGMTKLRDKGGFSRLFD